MSKPQSPKIVRSPLVHDIVMVVLLFTTLWVFTIIFYYLPEIWFDPFKFASLTISELLRGGIISAWTLFGTLFGLVLYRVSPTVRPIKVKNAPLNVLRFSILVLFVLVMLHFWYTFFNVLFQGGGFSLRDRSFLSKFSIFETLIVSSSFLLFRKIPGIVHVMAIIIQIFSIGYVFLDVTREALIPSAVVLLVAFQDKRGRLIHSAIFFFLFAYTIFGRSELDISNLSIAVFWESLLSAFGYVTVMNTLHVSDVFSRVADTGFTLRMFFQSIAPMPGSWIGVSNLGLRNIDAVRPYGAISDLFSLGPIFIVIVFAYFGFLLAATKNIKADSVKVILYAMLAIAFVQLHQYHLRTAIKFLYIPHLTIAIYALFRIKPILLRQLTGDN
jgi:hypothetical protein